MYCCICTYTRTHAHTRMHAHTHTHTHTHTHMHTHTQTLILVLTLLCVAVYVEMFSDMGTGDEANMDISNTLKEEVEKFQNVYDKNKDGKLNRVSCTPRISSETIHMYLLG